MHIKQNVNIHNRFDIHIDNVETGDHKEITAYNIVLDSMWTQLCNGDDYFEYIHFGTGTGTPTPGRTSLFSHLGTKSAVDEEVIQALPVSSWKRKIVLNPEEYVGQTITEVGIARGSSSSYLVTHAMLKDAEGNPISITKTDTDVVTIYATVFITLDTSNPNIVWKNAPSNSLVNYLVGGSSAPSGSFGLLAIPGAYARLGSTSNVAWTADTVNKQRKTDVKRFGITDANGNAQVLDFENLFALRFPAAGIHAGQPYTGVMLGTGDGTKTDFELPSKNLIDGSLSVSVDGLGTTDYTVAETDDGLYTLATPPSTPSRGYSVALSTNGSVLAIGASDTSPYVKVYDWTGTEWTARPTPPNMADYGYSVALSSDGSVLAVATFVSSPYVKVYDWTGTEWTAKPTPPGLPSMILTVALSPDGGVLAIGASGNSPYVKVYTSNEATSTTVQFNTAPAIGEIITADYTVKGVHKTDQYVIDVSFAIQFGEGV
jgi:hypothetical protein